MGPGAIFTEALQDFTFAFIFVVAAPPLARFLYVRTHCQAAAMLVGIGMTSAAVGLIFLGIAAWPYIQDYGQPNSPFATAALVCQLGGATIMTGSLVFTRTYAKKLIRAGALDPSLRANRLGLRSRRLT